jgi:hypothetical protein
VTADALGTLALLVLTLGVVSVGTAIPWPVGVGLLAVGAVGWTLWGR